MYKILEKYINNEKGTVFSNYDLTGITKLLFLLGNPQNLFSSIHVAGTNGKGTTCYLIARTLESAGYKTGLFISPHLLRINERISINSSEISDTELYHYIKQIDDTVRFNDLQITYFDLLTAVSFCYFRDCSVDLAVIETGLGGRLDSTNVLKPVVSVITDISIDHTHILGATLSEIAKEKCGIIKTDTPVITTNNYSEVKQIIQNFAEINNSRFLCFGQDFKCNNISFENGYIKFNYSINNNFSFFIEVPFMLEHQVKNSSLSATVLLILKEYGFNNITQEIIAETFRKAVIPGRFEILSRNPVVIYDPAHNISALKELFHGIDKLYYDNKKMIIMTMMSDKITDDILQLLNKYKDNIIYYILNDQRVYIPGKNDFSLVTDDKMVILQRIKTEINSNTIILITGTFRIYELALNVSDVFKCR